MLIIHKQKAVRKLNDLSHSFFRTAFAYAK